MNATARLPTTRRSSSTARLGRPRLAVIACMAVATGALSVAYVRAVADTIDLARVNAEQSFTDREIAGGNSVVPDQALLYAAWASIPEEATYEVIVGEPVEGWSELTSAHAAGYLRYFLLPRRQAAGAPWVVCFACDRALVGGDLVWEGDDGLSLLRREA